MRAHRFVLAVGVLLFDLPRLAGGLLGELRAVHVAGSSRGGGHPARDTRRARDQPGFRPHPPGYRGGMELSLLLLIIGIVLAVLVSYPLGIICILVGLVLLVWPRLRAGRADRV